jgi:hypothetical protein
MAASSTRWGRRSGRLSTAMCRQALHAAAPGVAEILRDLGEPGGQHLAPWNDHEIDRGRRPLRSKLPEHLSNQSFRPITLDRPAELPGGHDPQPWARQGIGKQQEREKPALKTGAAIEHPPELATAPYPSVFGECGRGRPRSFQEPPVQCLRRRNGQALTPLCAAPLEDVPAVLRGHPGQEAMSAPPPAAIRLKRAFTLHNGRYPCETELFRRKPRW